LLVASLVASCNHIAWAKFDKMMQLFQLGLCWQQLLCGGAGSSCWASDAGMFDDFLHCDFCAAACS